MSTRARLGAPLLTVLVLAASAAGGFLLYRFALAPPRATLYPSASPRMPVPGSAQDGQLPRRAIPEMLPDLSLPAVDGTPHRLTDWKGRPLVVNFWATWCEPCRREIPLLRSLRHERAAQGLEVLGIAVDMRDAVREYAAHSGIDYPVLIGEEGGLAAVDAFGMDTVLPFSVFVDRAGQVVTLKVGELHRDEAVLILDRLADVDAGRLTLRAAREAISSGIERLNIAREARKG